MILIIQNLYFFKLFDRNLAQTMWSKTTRDRRSAQALLCFVNTTLLGRLDTENGRQGCSRLFYLVVAVTVEV